MLDFILFAKTIFQNGLPSQVLGIKIWTYLSGATTQPTTVSISSPSSAIQPYLPGLLNSISVYFLIPSLPPAHEICSLQLIVSVVHVRSLPSIPSLSFLCGWCPSFLQADLPPTLMLVPSFCALIAP